MIRNTKWVLLILAFAVTSCIAQPKLEIENGGRYDWGKVKAKDSPIKAKLKLFNTGNDTLRIKEVKPGCGCTTAPLDKKNIEPGGFATLDISLSITSYSGSVSKIINVESNDPSGNPPGKQIISLIADVFRPLIFFPNQYLNFGAMKVGQESSAKLVINNKTDKPIKIVKIDFSPANLKFSLKEGDVIPAMGDHTLEAKIIPQVAGPFSARITFNTDSPEAESVTVSGSGRIETDAPKMEEPKTNETAPKK